MDFKKRVGERLKELRKEKGMTMQQVADIMGKDRVTITRYESGNQNLSADTIEEICKALNVSPDLIFRDL